MNPKVKTLANQMKKLRASGETFVLMLGAGASVSSGIPLTKQIIGELLEQFGGDIAGTDTLARFDKLWTRTIPEDRERYLAPYLNQRPGEGMRRLARLTKAGYFDCILTLNFDRLVETAFADASMRAGDDFQPIVRGDHDDAAVLRMMERKTPAVKVLKLHGSLAGGSTLLFSDMEMSYYPDGIRDLVGSVTTRHIIICGYGFEDMCVAFAFSQQGGPIYCVNPGGMPKMLRPVVQKRNSQDFAIDGDSGYFDKFMEELERALEESEAPVARPKMNPFKYLGSLGAEDRESLYGRDKELQKLIQNLESKDPVCVIGKTKTGKTSLVRAGLLAALDANRHLEIYVRCRGGIVHSLEQLRARFEIPAERQDIHAMLDWVAEAARAKGKRAILILDQFERVNQGEGVEPVLERLLLYEHANLTMVLLATDENNFLTLMLMNKELLGEMVFLQPLGGQDMRKAVEASLGRAGVTFDSAILDRLEGLYAGPNFSLAHVQAMCAVLCERTRVDLKTYEDTLAREKPVLDLVINSCDIVNLIEDVPARDAALLRKIIRDLEHPECNRKIVDCVKQINDLAAPMSKASAAGNGN